MRTSEKINLEMLKREDPILMYADLHLYEDELADNGISLLSVKMVRILTFFGHLKI